MSENFVARAGSFIDRSHRVAGLLLLLVVALTIMIMVLWGRNGDLVRQNTHLIENMPVYVVPGSTRGIYSPTEDSLLINAFVDTMTQSLNTFTYETLGRQYDEMRPFFTAEMLTYSQSYFEKLLRDSTADRRSQLFIPERRSMTVQNAIDNGVEARQVSIRGSMQTIIAGSVVESVPLEINLRLRQVQISKTNPFGFMLAGYNVRRLQQSSTPTPMAPLVTPEAPLGMGRTPSSASDNLTNTGSGL